MDQQQGGENRNSGGGRRVIVSISITLILSTGIREIIGLPAYLEPLIRPLCDSNHCTVCSTHMLRMTPLNRLLCSSVHHGEEANGLVYDSGHCGGMCVLSAAVRSGYSVLHRGAIQKT